MRFACPSCGTPYHVPDERVPGRGVRTRCKSCGTVLFIDKRTGSVRKEPTGDPGEKDAGTALSSRFQEKVPSVLALSKGVKKEKDFFAGTLLILVIAMGIGAGYFALTRWDIRPFKAWTAPLSRLRNAFSPSRMLRELTGKKPFSVPEKERRPTPRLVRKGYELYLKERLHPALEAFDEALTQNPADAKAHYWKGRTLLKMGRDEAALEAFLKALEIRPDYWEALDNTGWLYLRRGNYTEALAFLNRSIALKPDNAWAYYNRGFIHAKTGNSESALKDAEAACHLGYEKGCRMAETYEKPKGTEEP